MDTTKELKKSPDESLLEEVNEDVVDRVAEKRLVRKLDFWYGIIHGV